MEKLGLGIDKVAECTLQTLIISFPDKGLEICSQMPQTKDWEHVPRPQLSVSLTRIYSTWLQPGASVLLDNVLGCGRRLMRTCIRPVDIYLAKYLQQTLCLIKTPSCFQVRGKKTMYGSLVCTNEKFLSRYYYVYTTHIIQIF